MFHVKKKNLENKVQKDQTKLNSLIAYQKKVKNICRNKKKYPVAYRAKFTVPATTSTIIKLAKILFRIAFFLPLSKKIVEVYS